MTLTRANIEAVLVRRAGKKMSLVDFAITTAGSNADLDDPLATALRKMSLTVSVPVTDTNLSALTDSQQDEFLARAELRLMENIAENIDFSDISVGSRQESMNQLAEQCAKAIERLETRIEKEFGGGLGALQTGNILLDFAQKYDEDEL